MIGQLYTVLYYKVLKWGLINSVADAVAVAVQLATEMALNSKVGCLLLVVTLFGNTNKAL